LLCIVIVIVVVSVLLLPLRILVGKHGGGEAILAGGIEIVLLCISPLSPAHHNDPEELKTT
jgi:hypothetical protein